MDIIAQILKLASIADKAAIAKLVDDYSIDIHNLQNDSGTHLLVLATTHSSSEVALETLLQFGVHPDVTGKDGQYALTVAAAQSSAQVDALLRHKANVNVQDKKGHTPLMYATVAGNEVVVKKLLKAKADINVVNREGYTALMLAVMHNRKAITELLLDYDADIDRLLPDGSNILDLAKRKNHRIIWKILRRYTK